MSAIRNTKNELEIDYETELDDEIKAILPHYIEGKIKDVEDIKIAFQNKDLKIIFKIVHKIKGTALNYGQVKLDAIVRDLEKALLSNSLPDIENQILIMEQMLKAKK